MKGPGEDVKKPVGHTGLELRGEDRAMETMCQQKEMRKGVWVVRGVCAWVFLVVFLIVAKHT